VTGSGSRFGAAVVLKISPQGNLLWWMDILGARLPGRATHANRPGLLSASPTPVLRTAERHARRALVGTRRSRRLPRRRQLHRFCAAAALVEFHLAAGMFAVRHSARRQACLQ